MTNLSGSFVYCHLKADSDEPFYVGIGTNVKRPWDMHNGRSQWHKDTVKKHGVRVEIIIDELDRKTAKFWEVKWIKALKDSGYKLVNMTSGGDGLNGMSLSQETKNKISLSLLSKGENHHSKSPEHRAKNSSRQKANSENHIMKLPEKREWKKQEWEEKFGGSPMLIPEIAKKVSVTRKAQWATLEFRMKMLPSSWYNSNVRDKFYWGA